MLSPIVAAEPVTITLSDRTTKPLPRDVFGQFLERPSWGAKGHEEFGPEAVCDEQGRLPAKVEEHLAGLHTSLVRFPVGTDGDYIDWQDMVDLPGRSARPVTVGHLKNKVTNRFGFPEYFDLARRMEWRTILVANLRDAVYKKKPLPEAAAHAAALLRYGLEHAPKNSIAAFQIGNEGWFFWPPKPEEREKLGMKSDEDCSRWLRECLVAYADAARTVAPSLPLICDAPRPDDGGGLENSAGVVWRTAVNHPDIRSRYQMLAAHAYAPMGLWGATRDGQKVDMAKLSEDEVWNGLVVALGRYDEQGQCVADSVAYQDIADMGFQTAVTEWNSSVWDFKKKFPQVTFQEGVPSALGTAGFLHGLMRHPNVALATQSMMLGTQWGIASVRVKPDGSVLYGVQGEVTRLYAEHHGDAVLEVAWAGMPSVEKPVALASWWPQVKKMALLDVVATAQPKAVYAHIVNRSRTEAQPVTLCLPDNIPAEGKGVCHTLTGDIAQVTTSGQGKMERGSRPVSWGQRRLQITLPPASVSVVVLPR
jgi:alpha-L-arabinofuranosidase